MIEGYVELPRMIGRLVLCLFLVGCECCVLSGSAGATPYFPASGEPATIINKVADTTAATSKSHYVRESTDVVTEKPLLVNPAAKYPTSLERIESDSYIIEAQLKDQLMKEKLQDLEDRKRACEGWLHNLEREVEDLEKDLIEPSYNPAADEVEPAETTIVPNKHEGRDAQLQASIQQNNGETEAEMLKRLNFVELISRSDLPRTCGKLKSLGFTKTGRYRIDPDGPHGPAVPIEIYCDMETGESRIDNNTKPEAKADNQAKAAVDADCIRGDCSAAEPFRYLANEAQTGRFQNEAEVQEPGSFEKHKVKGWWITKRGTKKAIHRLPKGGVQADSQRNAGYYYSRRSSNPQKRTQSRHADAIMRARHQYSMAQALGAKGQTPLHRWLTIQRDNYNDEISDRRRMKRFADNHNILPRKVFDHDRKKSCSECNLETGESISMMKGKEDEDSQKMSKRKVPVPVFDGCHALYESGIKESGYHWIKTGEVYRLVFCDMHFLFEDQSRGIAQVPIGPRSAAQPVYFHASRVQPFNQVREKVPYQRTNPRVNAGINLQTGEFTAPVDGHYRLYFQTLNAGMRRMTMTSTEVYLIRKAGGRGVTGALTSMLPWSVGVAQAVLHLRAGDVYYMRLHHGAAWSTVRGFTFFTGALLSPD